MSRDEIKSLEEIMQSKQTLDDLDPESVNSVRSVGITAGASTPKKIIEEVHTNVRIKRV